MLAVCFHSIGYDAPALDGAAPGSDLRELFYLNVNHSIVSPLPGRLSVLKVIKS